MQSIKAEVIEIIQSLPDNSTLEEIGYRLYVRGKIDRGLNAVNEGNYISEEEAGKRIGEWSTSFGLSQH